VKKLIIVEKQRVLSLIQGEKDLKYLFGAKNIKIRCKNIHAVKVSRHMPKSEAWHDTCHHRHGHARLIGPFLLFF